MSNPSATPVRTFPFADDYTPQTDAEMLLIPVGILLPQRPPFVMISQLSHYDEVVTATRLRVEADNLFCEEGRLSASGLIENIAQTCAARIGFINKFILHRDVNIGYIGAVRNLEIHRLPLVGELIETRIEVLSSQFGLTLAHGAICLADGTPIADGEMKIALSEKTVPS